MVEIKYQYIPLDKCIHGRVYMVDARNFSIAVFNSNNNSFIGIRSKFWDTYLFPEDHFDTGEPYGTVKPLEEIEDIPKEIEIKDILLSDNDDRGNYNALLDYLSALHKKLQEL